MENSIRVKIDGSGNKIVEASLRGCVYKDDDSWTAEVTGLDIATYADTKAEAIGQVAEAVRGYLSVCVNEGILHNILVNRGWKITSFVNLDGLMAAPHPKSRKFVAPNVQVDAPEMLPDLTHWESNARIRYAQS